MNDQISLSMAVFADFVSKSGQTKATVVKNWKYKPSYSPALDFYKQVRDALPEYCRKKLDRTKLDSLIANASPQKRAHYEAAIEGFIAWKKTKTGKWVEPESAAWVSDRVRIGVRPEIAYKSSGGVVNYVKLYFRAEKLNKRKADLYLEMMAGALNISRSESEVVVSVLDVKSASEYHAVGTKPTLNALLRAEAASWSVLWDLL